MNIYFARSIRGKHNSRDEEVNQTIINLIKQHGHVPALELPTLDGMFDNVNHHIYQRDLHWIDQCHALIAEVTNPSLGVGYEIAYALHVRKIPILAIARHMTKVSAMIAGANHYGLEMNWYTHTRELADIVEIFLHDNDLVPSSQAEESDGE